MKEPREKALDEIVRQLQSGAIPVPVTSAMVDQLARRHGLTRRSVLAHVIRMGFPYKSSEDVVSEDDFDDEANDEELIQRAPMAAGVQSTSQYGPLQGVANVTGGCASLWGWLFFGLSLLILWMLIIGQF